MDRLVVALPPRSQPETNYEREQVLFARLKRETDRAARLARRARRWAAL